MDDLGITLSYREHEGRRQYIVYVVTVEYDFDGIEYGEGANELLGVYGTLEGAQNSAPDATWNKVDDMAIWWLVDEHGDHYAIQEVPVA